jgi:hypothetical protein
MTLFPAIVYSKTRYKINNIHGPFTKEDYKEMREESEKLVNFLTLSSNFTFLNDTNANYTTMEYEKLKIENELKDHNDTFICKACLWTFTKFHNFLEKKYGLFILNDFLALLCSIKLDYNICKAAIYLYSPTIIDSLIEHYLDAEVICTKTHICKNAHFIELNSDDYARELLKDKPKKGNLVLKESNSSIKILHVTDIHTDLLYKEVI